MAKSEPVGGGAETKCICVNYARDPKCKAHYEPVGASLSTTLGNCICGHGYASTCPVHGEPLQPDRGELMPLEQISGCIKDFTGGLPLREYLDEINEEDGFPRIAADESDAANIEENKRGVQTSTLATSDPQLGASLSAQTPPELIDRARKAWKSVLDPRLHPAAVKLTFEECREVDECVIKAMAKFAASSGAAQEGDCPCGATVVRKSDSANKSKLCADCAAQEEAPQKVGTILAQELRRRCNTKLSLLHQSAWYEAANELERFADSMFASGVVAEEEAGAPKDELAKFKQAANLLIDYCEAHEWGLMPEPFASINPLLALLGRAGAPAEQAHSGEFIPAFDNPGVDLRHGRGEVKVPWNNGDDEPQEPE